MAPRLVLVGNPEEIHIGAHLHKAAQGMGVETEFSDVREAYASGWLARAQWKWGARRPAHLIPFSRRVVETCRRFKPTHLLCVGLAPVDESALREIGRMGIRRLNYLTDDPWNPAHRASWFLLSLPCYDEVFSTRTENLQDLRALGLREVSYLPFGYEPSIHFPERARSEQERRQYEADLLFFGGADTDRISWIRPLVREKLRLALYGGYWDRYPETRSCHRGHADPRALRLAVSGAKVVLGLVRRANRDGNSMRSFEIPAMGGCMLAEDTEEHRVIFGEEGKTVLYVRSPEQMVEQLRWLLENEGQRERLSAEAHRLITSIGHTYADRLRALLGFPGGSGQD